jgi:hypothetical protein
MLDRRSPYVNSKLPYRSIQMVGMQTSTVNRCLFTALTEGLVVSGEVISSYFGGLDYLSFGEYYLPRLPF